MAVRTTRNRYFVAAPPAVIYEHLADPMSYIGLSPLLTEVSAIRHETDGDGQPVIRYKTVEAFVWLGFVRYNNPLNVTMSLARPNERLVTQVNAPFNTRLRFVFEFTPAENGTWVSEQIDAQAPALVIGYVVQQALEVQGNRSRVLQERLGRKS